MSDFISQLATVQTGFDADSGWVILSPLEAVIKNKIEAIGTPLKDWDVNINYGIKTGYNDAFIIDDTTRDALLKKCPKADEIIRPILRGKNIHRYQTDVIDQWVLYIPWHFPLHHDETIKGASSVAENSFRNEYEAIYNHLLLHKEALENRNKAETGIRYEWYALQRFGANYWRDFMKKKIVWGNLALKGSYAMVDSGVYINAPCAFIPTENLFILAILNSKLADFYIKRQGVSRNGGYFEYKPMFVERLPIPIVEQRVQNEFILKVNKLSEATNDLKHEIENEIDEMVFSLYDISEEEKQFIYNEAFEINSFSSKDKSNIS